MYKIFRSLSPPLSALLIAACAGQAPVTTIPGVGEPVPAPGRIDAPGPGEYTALLDEAASLLARRQLQPAASILRDVDSGKLPPEESPRHLLLWTELLHLQGRSGEALARLSEAIPAGPALEGPLADRIQDWRILLSEAAEGPLSAARLSTRLLTLTRDGKRRAELLRRGWRYLNLVALEDLRQSRQRSRDRYWRAWLELALLAARVTDSPSAQVAGIERWRRRYPNHPAAARLPGGLGLLAALETETPTRIALLLPLSRGPEQRARAVIDGFLAARYQARKEGWPRQDVQVFDIGAFEDINRAYEHCVEWGAELIIGPLTAARLQAWRPRESLPVPLLTLDWFDRAPESKEPWQMALSAEDEARQVARLAFAAGARSAMLISPEGDWGDRVGNALLEQWSRLEGAIRATARYTGQADYSASLKSALNLAGSEQRARRLRQLMGSPMEFSPRRRQDLDAIFLLADNPQDARSIKPLIAFHYAGDLPVYSTSRIFQGDTDPRRDRDLNGIVLVEMPWLLAPDSPLASTVSRFGKHPTFARLHALGADAFLLNWRLRQLAADTDSRVRGQTGLLHMDSLGRVHRELVPAIVSGGVPRRL